MCMCTQVSFSHVYFRYVYICIFIELVILRGHPRTRIQYNIITNIIIILYYIQPGRPIGFNEYFTNSPRRHRRRHRV